MRRACCGKLFFRDLVGLKIQYPPTHLHGICQAVPFKPSHRCHVSVMAVSPFQLALIGRSLQTAFSSESASLDFLSAGEGLPPREALALARFSAQGGGSIPSPLCRA